MLGIFPNSETYPVVDSFIYILVEFQIIKICISTDLIKTTWRFLALADQNVEEFHSRDLDSRPSHREMAAVKEFESLDLMFHIMRDHKFHRVPILGL